MQVEISYDCMGIGLQGKVSEVYYYLSFTSFPSGTYVNYTLVYMGMGECILSSCVGCLDSVISEDCFVGCSVKFT